MDGKLSRRDVIRLFGALGSGTLLANVFPGLARVLEINPLEFSTTESGVTDHDVFISNSHGVNVIVFRVKDSDFIAISTMERVNLNSGWSLIQTIADIVGGVENGPTGRTAIVTAEAQKMRKEDGDYFQRKERLVVITNVAQLFDNSQTSLQGFAVLDLIGPYPVLTFIEERRGESHKPRQIHVPLAKFYFDRSAPQGSTAKLGSSQTLYALTDKKQDFDLGINNIATQTVQGEIGGASFFITVNTGERMGVKSITFGDEEIIDLTGRTLFRAVWEKGLKYNPEKKRIPAKKDEYATEYSKFLSTLTTIQKSQDSELISVLDFKTEITNPVTGNTESIVVRPLCKGDPVNGVHGATEISFSMVDYNSTKYMKILNELYLTGYGKVLDANNGRIDLRFAMASGYIDVHGVTGMLSTAPALLANNKVTASSANLEIAHDLAQSIYISK